MITYFYKILYKNKDVVYIGVTTRKINQRFQEHVISKKLNNNYSFVEFDRIIHPTINSIEIFNKEKIKVFDLERKYIQEEKDKGSILFNISKGGEWGTNILNKLKKKYFFEKYGSYDGYKEYQNKIKMFNVWIRSWINCKTANKSKIWLKSWVNSRSSNKTKVWVFHWIQHRSENKTKVWVFHWIHHKSENKTKRWLNKWLYNKKSITYKWVRNWVFYSNENKTKRWLRVWILRRKKLT